MRVRKSMRLRTCPGFDTAGSCRDEPSPKVAGVQQALIRLLIDRGATLDHSAAGDRS